MLHGTCTTATTSHTDRHIYKPMAQPVIAPRHAAPGVHVNIHTRVVHAVKLKLKFRGFYFYYVIELGDLLNIKLIYVCVLYLMSMAAPEP